MKLSERLAQPEWMCAVLIVVFGLFFVVLHPPFDPPDEVKHMARAYMISGGQLLPPGRAPGHDGQVPRSLLRLHPLRGGSSLYPDHSPQVSGAPPHDFDRLLGHFSRPLNPDDTRRMLRTSYISVLPFLPSLLGAAPARWLELPPAWHLYGGRLMNLLVYAALCALAIRTMPIRKWAMVLVAASPMSVYLASSVSYDPMTNALAFLLAALCLRLALRETKGSAGAWAGLVALCAALGLAKPGYAPLALWASLIPARRFASSGQRWFVTAACLAAALATTGAWAWALQAIDGVGSEDFADPGAQVRGILADPLGYVGILFASSALQFIPFVAGFVGVLGQLDIALPLFFYALYPAALVAVCLSDAPDPAELGRRERAGLWGLFIAMAVVVMTIGYLSWNEVGSPIIVGVQGRYFIPLAPLVLVALPGCGKPGWSLPPAWIALLVTVTLSAAVAVTWLHDYA